MTDETPDGDTPSRDPEPTTEPPRTVWSSWTPVADEPDEADTDELVTDEPDEPDEPDSDEADSDEADSDEVDSDESDEADEAHEPDADAGPAEAEPSADWDEPEWDQPAADEPAPEEPAAEEPTGDDGAPDAEASGDAETTPEDTESDAEPEAEESEDAAAQRVALEAEIDRQLAGIAPAAVEDAEIDDAEADIEPDDEPMTAADEAERLIDELVPLQEVEADDEPTAPVEPAPTEDEPTQPAPVLPYDSESTELAGIAEAAVLAERSSRGPIVPLVVIGLLIAAVVAVVVAVGGGDDDPPTGANDATTSVVTTPGAPAGDSDLPLPAAEALGFFQIYGTQQPEHLTRMLALAAEGSPAWAYAKHQETLARIDPQRNAPLDVDLDGDEIKACPQDPATGGCVVYSDFRKNVNGRITHFSINGSPLRDRIALGTASEVVAGAMKVAVVSRYVSVSDRIFVAYTVTNAGTTPIEPVSVRYITPDGDTVEPDNDTFRAPVQPGTFSIAAAAFPTTDAGGTLAVVSTADGGRNQQVAQIQTP